MGGLFGPQGSVESFAKNLAEYQKGIDELEEVVEQEYKRAVDSYKEGLATPVKVESTMEEVAQIIDELDELSCDLVREKKVPLIEESNYDDEENKLVQEVESKGFEVPATLPNPLSYETEATNAEIAYQVFTEVAGEPDTSDELTRSEELRQIYDNTEERFSELRKEILNYEREFLRETLGTTFTEVMNRNTNPVERAEENRLSDAMKREKIMNTPRDSYLGYTESTEGTESFKKAREEVRETLETKDTGPTEEEIKENNKRIEESRESISEKEEVRYIH